MKVQTPKLRPEETCSAGKAGWKEGRKEGRKEEQKDEGLANFIGFGTTGAMAALSFQVTKEKYEKWRQGI